MDRHFGSLPQRRLDRVARFFGGNASSYDQVVQLFTLGADDGWKRFIVEACPRKAGRILDLGCGTGILTLTLARRFPDAWVVGMDAMSEYLSIAIRKAQAGGIPNVSFVLGNAEQLPLAESYDCITGSYLPKYVDAEVLSKAVADRLRPGGRVVLHDFVFPAGGPARWIWKTYLSALRLVGPVWFPEWRSVFLELAPLLQESTWTEDFSQALTHAGMDAVRVIRLSWGTAAIVTAERDGSSVKSSTMP